MNNSLFRSLGIYGYDRIEDIILAGLLTGDPVLLVGTHGTAKTLLCERLAKALGLKFIAYDASKALFEDVLGFPNPFSLKEDRIEYVSTDISISDKEFVLIDEISRANYQMQNKWLEIIRSRRIMGKKLESIKYIFAAMNPPNYPGARTLDPALAGRFSYIVWVPEFEDLSKEDKKNVISNITESDAVMLQKNIGYKQIYEDIKINKLLEEAKKSYLGISERFNETLDDFIIALEQVIRDKANELRLDGRRAGMIKRGLLSILSIMDAKGELSEQKIYEIILSTTPYLLPFSVVYETFEKDFIDYIILDALDKISDQVGSRREKIIMDHVALSRLESSIIRESDYSRKYYLIEKLYKIDFDRSQEMKKRFFDFHRNIFNFSKYEHIVELFIEGLNENQDVQMVPKSQIVAASLVSFFEESIGYSDFKKIFHTLDEIIKLRKGPSAN
ncbi:MAG: MoxR family ATPase [Candidatus Calescibacterium sp.]|nr:MoxR family ATPase [Candidatus Calescibacterium sp.]